MQHARAIERPSPQRLEAYVSGQLGEREADALAAHLEQCPTCQRRADELAAQPDSLVVALRRPRAVDEDQPSQLNLLIAAAVQQDTAPPAEKTKQDVPRSKISLDEFIARLCRSRLMQASDLDLVLAQTKPRDARSLARTLIRLERLTKFQAQAILQGRPEHLVLGNYVVLEQLGEGGMGRVFKARHRQLGRIVCLKVLHAAGRQSPQLVERFRREAQTVASLSHPHIVVAHDAAEADGVPYLAMEFIEGQDLARHVEEHGALDAATAAEIVLQAAGALSYAHSQGVIHRDIKPSNLLLASANSSGNGASTANAHIQGTDIARSPGCFVKVLDLGLARFDSLLCQSPDALSHTSMTATGVVMGTVDYMAPEQALNSRKADHRSDIYSLGCTLFFFVTGRAMYDGETVMEKLVAHRERPVPSLIDEGAEVPAALDAIFQRMVAKDPHRRYRSMLEVEEDLRLYLDGKLPQAMTQFSAPMIIEPPPLPDSRRGRRRSAIAMTIAVSIVLMVIVWGGWLVATVDWAGAFAPLAPADDATGGETSGRIESSPSIVGHKNTIANGGKGRAMIVVPHDGYYEDQFLSIRDALAAAEVEWKVVSSSATPARSKNFTYVPVDVTLDELNVNDFDAVIFIGGHVGEYTHQGASGSQAKSVIETAFAQPRVVASVGNGGDVLRDAAICQGCPTDSANGVTRYMSGDRPGMLLLAAESKHAPALVQVMLDGLKGLPSP